MSARKPGLGKSFDALMPKDFDTSLIMEAGERVKKVFIKDIEPNSEQPRTHFDKQALNELAASIKQYGVLQPIVLSPLTSTSDKKFIIVAGERRWRAAQIAGLEQIPAIVRDRKELEQLEIALVENVQRVDLSPIEQAVSIEKLHSQFNKSYSEIAKRLGKAETTISNIVRLLQLPPAAREALQSQAITEGHARAILSLKEDVAQQAQLLELILTNKWSVRQAEQYVAAVKSGANRTQDRIRHLSNETPATKVLAKRLNVPVTIRRTAKGGKLELHFKNDEALEQLIKRLQKS